ncbi:hypothetical protein D3C81_1780300 [compost metagenome]
MRSTVTFFTHQHVNATVVIGGVIERRNAIFLGPVGFEIGKRLVVKAANQRQGMGIGFEFAQVLAMLFEAALLLPETRDTRVVLPTIETHQILFDVQCAQGHPHAQTRIEAAIDFSIGFDRP